MEVIFILLLLVWIVIQLLSRPSTADKTGTQRPQEQGLSDVESGEDRSTGSVYGEPSARSTDPSDARPQARDRTESTPSRPVDDFSVPSNDSARDSTRRTAEGMTPRRVRERLKSHRSRREIFLLKELIDRPRSQRPWPL